MDIRNRTGKKEDEGASDGPNLWINNTKRSPSDWKGGRRSVRAMNNIKETWIKTRCFKIGSDELEPTDVNHGHLQGLPAFRGSAAFA